MNEFVFNTLVPALFFVLLLLGALCIVLVILSTFYSGRVAGDVFDTLFIIMFGCLCIVGVILMAATGVSGLVMLCH